MRHTQGTSSRRSRIKYGGAKANIAIIILVLIGAFIIFNIVVYAFPSIFATAPQQVEPEIYGITPVQNEIMQTSNVTITASYQDRGATIDSVQLSIDGSNVTAVVGPTGISYSGTFDQGVHTALLTVIDSKGRIATDSWSFVVNLSVSEDVEEVLNTINSARSEYGIPNVTLIETPDSVYRAQNMLTNQYFGHYDLNGYQPGLYYTQLGGAYTMEENIGYMYSPVPFTPTTLATQINNSVAAMIYNDAGSDYEHTASLLDPTNNYVDITFVNNDNQLFLVIHMIKEWVSWLSQPSLTNGTFSCSGVLNLNGSEVASVVVYYSNPSAYSDYQYDSQLHVLVGASSYSIGQAVAEVAPSPLVYEGVNTVRPTTWYISGQNFEISFPLNATEGPGVYTVAIFANNVLSARDPVDPTRYADTLPILNYAVSLS